MNRVTVILLTLAILFAHGLAIHQTAEGDLGSPYELAHVAYRLGRNLVHQGAALWNPGEAVVESYPSPLWVGVCALAERFYVSPIRTTQWLGIACALGTVFVLAQFSSKRMSGLIAPLLLAASGTAAAAGTSGTEAPLAMLLVTGSFLAFEWSAPRALASCLTVLMLTRPESLFLLGFLFVTEAVLPPDGERKARRSMRHALLPPLVVGLGLGVFRQLFTGAWLSPTQAAFVGYTPDNWLLGLHYLKGFFLCSGSGPLVVLPILFGLTGSLSGTGKRALLFFLFWSALVVLSGGDELPMWNTLAPVLPLLFLSIQEAISGLLDKRPRLAPVGWTLLVTATCASFLASKAPGNLGPIPLGAFHERWMQPRGEVEAFDRPLGRMGLATEIREVERLRSVSVFLRDNIAQPSTILTFWPGAIGYLSRKKVYDVLGRAYPAPGRDRLLPWRGIHALDLIEAIDTRPDYIVPVIEPLTLGSTPISFLREWLRNYDTLGGNEGRLGELTTALQPYELVSVPVPANSRRPEIPSPTPHLLLRRIDLGLTPSLQVDYDPESRSLDVRVHHHGHQQVVDLRVEVVDAQGESWFLRPMGSLVRGERVHARTSILLYPTGNRPIQMLEATLPAELDASRIEARLFNPGTFDASRLAFVGPAVVRKL